MCGGPEHSKPVLGSKNYGIMLADGAASRSSFAYSEAPSKQQSSWSHGGKDFNGQSSCVSLLELAADNDVEAFRLSVEDDGMDLDEPDNWYVRVIAIGKMALEKRTPLMIAALYGSVEVLGYILESGRVDVNRVGGEDNVTALHCAAAGGSPRAAEVVQLLLRAGANKSAVDAHGRRPVEVILVPPKLPYVRAALENMLAEAQSSFGCEEIECRNGHQSDGGAASGVAEKDEDDVVTVFGEARDGFISISSSPCSSPGSASPKLSPQYPSSPKFAEIPSDGSDKARDYPVDPSLPDIKNSIYTTDEFRMFSFKVRPCSRAYSHDWTECPFVHPGENARRRDPRRYHYSCVPCPDFRKGSCRRGDACEYAHGVFECWLHPAQYRTRSCKDGTNCTRRVCFFAHTSEEMRPLYVSMGSAVPSPRASSPLDARSMSPPLSAVSQSPVLMIPPFSPSNASGSGLSTPPLSPSASSLGGSWSQPNVPTLHLPGGAGLHVSRLRAALNARDIPSDDFSRNSDFEGHLASEFSSLSTHGRQNSSAVLMGSGSSSGRMHKFGNLGLNIPATNLQDLFCSEVSPMSPAHQSQLNAQDHPNLSQQLHSQLQLQQLLSPLSPMSQLQGHVSPQLQSSGQSIFSGGSPRSIPSRRCDLELQSSPGASLSGDVINARKAAAFAQRERGSWSLKDYTGSIPSPSWSDWGSPSGKPDWGVQGQDLGKFRKSASFASHGGAEPDLSWVQTLVKDGPVELESSGGSSPQASGKMLHPENVDCLVGGGWVEQQTHNSNQMV